MVEHAARVDNRMSAPVNKPLPFPVDINRALYEASSLLLEPVASDVIVARLVDLAKRFVAADAYAVWKRADDNSAWRVMFSDGLAGDYPDIVVPTDPRTEISDPFVFEDVQQVPVSAEQKQRYARDGIRSLISLPLKTQGSLFGALTLYFRQRHAPAPGEIELLAAIANIAATALKNALLFESLKLERERLALAQDAARCWSWEIDLQTGAATLSRPLGEVWPEAESLDTSTLAAIVAAVHAGDRPMIEEKIRQAAATAGQDHEVEYRFILPGQVQRWVYSRGRCIEDSTGKRLVGISVDVTDRRAAAEALQRSEKLAAAGRMAATVAHELNNPLEAVTNLLYLLESGNMVSNEGRELLRKAQEELERVAQMTKQTLGFYRDTSKPSRFRFSEVFEEVRVAYWPKIARRMIAVEQEIEPGEPEVNSYRGEARQILSNLLANAIDAASGFPAGTLAGDSAYIRFSVRREGERVHFVLADNGVGIPAENFGHIFEPFFTTKKDVGTGLGLWVTRDLVEKRGGTIHARCADGWTEFHVDYPIGER